MELFIIRQGQSEIDLLGVQISCQSPVPCRAHKSWQGILQFFMFISSLLFYYTDLFNDIFFMRKIS
ncbi:hypothetical protein BACCIP111895_01719 [Neobacillus rhizosphaerae]|uniref:Uncharacterized protein n=1 Tax=Neobacillus rhizosphaerae TaxID=2880965 RepID=A0ABN8KM65_9BACI|nr:hypothetical protein BACCIP111895_01719 [Neobacillus rhizosphaerae]